MVLHEYLSSLNIPSEVTKRYTYNVIGSEIILERYLKQFCLNQCLVTLHGLYLSSMGLYSIRIDWILISFVFLGLTRWFGTSLLEFYHLSLNCLFF